MSAATFTLTLVNPTETAGVNVGDVVFNVTMASTGPAGPTNWNLISNKPDTFPPAAHTHPISEVANLQTELDGKAAASHTHPISEVANLQTELDGKAASSHTHAISEVAGLQTELDGKAASSHTHAISDVTGLQTALDAKVESTTITNIEVVSAMPGTPDPNTLYIVIP